jgi:hypothetical protein
MVIVGAARADAGPPPLPTLNYQETPQIVLAAFAGCLVLAIAFAGLWAIRHPLAALGVFLLTPGAIFIFAGGVAMIEGTYMGLVCMAPGFIMSAAGIYLLWQRAPFTGRSLVYLIVAAGFSIGTIVAASQTKWIPGQRVRPRPPAIDKPETAPTPAEEKTGGGD